MDLPASLTGSEHEAFARDVLAGLGTNPKRIEPRWLYDAVGAKLFEAVTKLDHYYPARTEMALLEEAAADIADWLGTGVTIVEPGSGEAVKVRPLLAALGDGARGYVPIDIAADQLDAVAAEMAALYPALNVDPVAADFFRPFAMPRVENAVVFFPGSTIGNMTEDGGVDLLKTLRSASGAGRFLVGFDLVKDRKVLEDAYDDPAGVTAAFEKNLLQRINRELGGDFDLRRFGYRARFDETTSAVEMELVALEPQTVSVAGRTFTFEEGETLHTEQSRKYTLDGFAAVARRAGLREVTTWTDEREYFAIMLLEAAD
jgi:dimethylhistidine N-methyltransferase